MYRQPHVAALPAARRHLPFSVSPWGAREGKLEENVLRTRSDDTLQNHPIHIFPKTLIHLVNFGQTVENHEIPTKSQCNNWQ